MSARGGQKTEDRNNRHRDESYAEGTGVWLVPSATYRIAFASVMCENMQQILRAFQMQFMQDAGSLVGQGFWRGLQVGRTL